MAERKRFGGRRRRSEEEFDLVTVDDNDVERVHTFRVSPNIQAGDVIGLMDAVKHAPEKSVDRITHMLRRVLSNRDGVSASWELKPLPQEDGDDRPPSFRGPDGELYRMDDDASRAKFVAFDAGSSRRRWEALLDPESTEGVALDDLIDIVEWVISLATARPTSPRA